MFQNFAVCHYAARRMGLSATAELLDCPVSRLHLVTLDPKIEHLGSGNSLYTGWMLSCCATDSAD